ncbi:MAG: formate dehydrogenase accessory sulfurtransferase FdhD [Planctomycetota bacterium]
MQVQRPETEKRVSITAIDGGERQLRDDVVAMEEPMEVRIVFGPEGNRKDRSLAITMRTPDFDFELAAGFLLTEGIIHSPQDISEFEFCGPVAEGREYGNIVRVKLSSDVELDVKSFQRHFYTTSSCGVCGKGSLDALSTSGLKRCESDDLRVEGGLIRELPDRLRQRQSVFHKTGGIHAAGLFSLNGDLVLIREDVGRHNALDKLLGNRLIAGELPLSSSILAVSGRASFELLQKALVGRIPVMVAVGAPSSLAVDLAGEFGMTLIGFASESRFNIYTHPERIV